MRLYSLPCDRERADLFLDVDYMTGKRILRKKEQTLAEALIRKYEGSKQIRRKGKERQICVLLPNQVQKEKQRDKLWGYYGRRIDFLCWHWGLEISVWLFITCMVLIKRRRRSIWMRLLSLFMIVGYFEIYEVLMFYHGEKLWLYSGLTEILMLALLIVINNEGCFWRNYCM